MRHSSILLLAAVAVFAAASAPADPPRPPYLPPNFDSGEFLRVKEVRPGMKGTGLTVFRGTEPEEFSVEVIGVEPAAGLAPTIVARLSGPAITERRFNYLSGMEGSPVYLGGKLAGCVTGALGSFGREAIVSIVPIEYVFEALDPQLPTKPTDRTQMLASSSPGRTRPEPALRTRPVLLVSGATQETIDRLRSAFPGHRIEASGSGGDGFPSREVRPGSAVGVYFCVGDVEMGTAATVTYRDGDTVLALGGPASGGVGATNLFLRESKVEWSLSSLASGFKLDVPGRVIGRVYQDRPFGVAAKLGEMVEAVPVRVKVTDKTTGKSRTFETQVAQNPDYTRTLLPAIVGDAFLQTRTFEADTLTRLRFDAEIEEVGHIKRENVFFDPRSPDVALAALSQLVMALGLNKFHPFKVLSLSVEAELETARPVAEIQEVTCDAAEIEPGKTLGMEVVLKPYKAPEERVRLSLAVPSYAPAGEVTLTVRGGSAASPDTVSSVSGKGPGSSDISASLVPGTLGAETMEQILRKFERLPRGDDLVAEVVLDEVYPRVRGETLTNLPDPQSDVLLTPLDSGALMESEIIRTSQRTSWIITGEKSVKLNILEKEEARTP